MLQDQRGRMVIQFYPKCSLLGLATTAYQRYYRHTFTQFRVILEEFSIIHQVNFVFVKFAKIWLRSQLLVYIISFLITWPGQQFECMVNCLFVYKICSDYRVSCLFGHIFSCLFSKSANFLLTCSAIWMHGQLFVYTFGCMFTWSLGSAAFFKWSVCCFQSQLFSTLETVWIGILEYLWFTWAFCS